MRKTRSRLPSLPFGFTQTLSLVVQDLVGWQGLFGGVSFALAFETGSHYVALLTGNYVEQTGLKLIEIH